MGLSTHILDTSLGKPAAGVRLRLCDAREGEPLTEISTGVTDADGRCTTLLRYLSMQAITYELTFETGGYFEARGTPALHPYVKVVFTVTDPSEHHHIPLLVSPHAYTTYRGS